MLPLSIFLLAASWLVNYSLSTQQSTYPTIHLSALPLIHASIHPFIYPLIHPIKNLLSLAFATKKVDVTFMDSFQFSSAFRFILFPTVPRVIWERDYSLLYMKDNIACSHASVPHRSGRPTCTLLHFSQHLSAVPGIHTHCLEIIFKDD